MQSIDRERFERRLLELLRAKSGFPRKPVDRHILLKSAALMLGVGGDEAAVNAAIMRWQALTGAGLDYVTWRRYLVDWGYLARDRARTAYAPAVPPGVSFAPEVAGVDIPRLIAAGRAETERRRQEFLGHEGRG